MTKVVFKTKSNFTYEKPDDSYSLQDEQKEGDLERGVSFDFPAFLTAQKLLLNIFG